MFAFVCKTKEKLIYSNLGHGSPYYSPRSKSTRWSHFIQSTNAFCQ